MGSNFFSCDLKCTGETYRCKLKVVFSGNLHSRYLWYIIGNFYELFEQPEKSQKFLLQLRKHELCQFVSWIDTVAAVWQFLDGLKDIMDYREPTGLLT